MKRMILQDHLAELRRHLRVIEREIGLRAKSDTPCCGVTVAQCHALLALEESGSASVSVLAGSLGLDSSSASRTIDSLVADGYASRSDNPNDRRYASVGLTEKGKGIVLKINDAFDKAFEPVLESVPEAEQPVIVEAVRKLAIALAGLRNPGCCSEDETGAKIIVRPRKKPVNDKGGDNI